MADIGTDFTSVDASFLGVIPGMPASVATRKLQELLNAGGEVTITRPGTYFINDTLWYDSYTRLVGVPGVVLKNVAGTLKPLLRSRAYQRMVSAPVSVSISGSSGSVVTVTWPSHGKSIGDAVWIDGPSLAPMFKGVFEVESVTDANTFTYRTNRAITGAPSGNVFAVTATRDFFCKNVDFDYTGNGGFSSILLNRHAIINVGVMNVWFNDVAVDNASKYCMLWMAHRSCGFNNLHANRTDSDGVKIYGPAHNFRGKGLTGEFNDDVCSYQTLEPPDFIEYQPFFGDLTDCLVENIAAKSTISLAVFYSRRLADGIMDRCFFRNISGTGAQGVRIVSQSALAGETVERSIWSIGAENVRVNGTYAVKVDTVLADEVILKKIYPTEKTTSTDHILVGAASDIRVLRIQEPYNYSDVFSVTGTYITYNGIGELLDIEAASVRNSASAQGRLLNLTSNSQVPMIVIDGLVTNADQVVDVNATNNPTIVLTNSRLGGAGIISVRRDCTVSLSGNDIVNASNGFIRFNTATATTAVCTLRSAGNNRLRAGSWAVNVGAGTSTLAVYGFDITIDPTATTFMATTQGQYCFSTQAGAEGGPSVRGPSAWYALAAGASGANGAIT